MISHFKEYWIKQPLIAKILWVVSVFLSSSSIASLSKTVFAWKGFILDSIRFYQKMLHPLFYEIAALLSIELTPNEVDLLVIWSIFQIAFGRANWKDGLAEEIWFNFLMVFSYMGIFIMNKQSGNVELLFFVTFLIALMPIPIWGYLAYSGDPSSKKVHTTKLITCYSTILGALLVVAIMAAVNKGLNITSQIQPTQ